MRTNGKGFTLIEVMIVVAIVGILAAIAYPSYVEYVKRTHRAEIVTILSEQAQLLERYYSQHGAYTVTGAAPTVSSGNTYYTITATLAAQSFSLSAVGKDMMLNDKCGTFTITHTGAISTTNASNGVTRKDCWGR